MVLHRTSETYIGKFRERLIKHNIPFSQSPITCYALLNSLWDVLDLHPLSSIKILPFQNRSWNMAAEQNTSKSTDREVNSLLSGSNRRLTGSQNHRKWELKGNTRLYLVHSFASGKINYTYTTPYRCLSNSITSPSNPFQCVCLSALLMASFSYCLIWISTAVL